MASQNFTPWNAKLLERFAEVTRKYDLPEDIENDISAFILDVAREQYRTGNNSGIAWMRKQASTKQGMSYQPVPAGV